MTTEISKIEDYYELQNSLKHDIETFIVKNMSFCEREEATNIAINFYNANKPINSTIALIPVAAHQESERIIPAMAEYAKQQNSEPITILLHLNSPYQENNSEVQKTLKQVQKAQQMFGNLDIRCSYTEYPTTTIGKIRKDLWNSAVILAHHDGLFDEPQNDIVGLNHDIDIEYLSPHYIARIQKYYQKQKEKLSKLGVVDRMPPAFTKITHKIPENYPNIGKAVFWSDFLTLQLKGIVGFEASIAMPFSHYIYTGGFDESGIYESANIFDDFNRRSIPNTLGKTSARRYIERLQSNGLNNIWTEDSFSQTDACRNSEIELEDISKNRLKEIISESLEKDLENYFLGSAYKEMSNAILTDSMMTRLGIANGSGLTSGELLEKIKIEYKILANRKLRLASQVLKNTLELPELAEFVDNSYDRNKALKKYALSLSKNASFWQKL